jgi:hypothetical protein
MFIKLLSRRQKIMNRLKTKKTEIYYGLIADLEIPDTGKTFKVGHVGGIAVPKQCNLSRQKRQRMLKGKSICQKAHEHAARRPKK